MSFRHLGLAALLAAVALPASAGQSDLYMLGIGAGDFLSTAIEARAEGRVASCGVGPTFPFGDASTVLTGRIDGLDRSGSVFTLAHSGAKVDRVHFSGMTVAAVPESEPYALVATGPSLMRLSRCVASSGRRATGTERQQPTWSTSA